MEGLLLTIRIFYEEKIKFLTVLNCIYNQNPMEITQEIYFYQIKQTWIN